MRTLIVAVILFAALPAFAQVDLIADPAMQHPIVRVPLAREPHVDGIARKGEWTQYARLHDMTVSMGDDAELGFAAPEPTEVRVAYSEKGLAVAFRMSMQPDAPPHRTVTEGHDTAFNDDAFEIIVMPDPASSRVLHFGGTAAGVTWDRVAEGSHPDWTWNPDYRYAAHVDEGNNWWSGEWLIPWSTLGINMPKPGDELNCNFVANRRSPRFRLDVWSYWKKWWDLQNNGRIIFGGKCAAFQMVEPTNEAFNGKGMWPAVYAEHHTLDDPAQVDYEYRVYRREAAGQSFNKALLTRRNEATGEAATFASFTDDVSAVLSDYTIVTQLRKIERVPAAGWTGPWGGHIKLDQPGDYVLAYRLLDKREPEASQLLAAGAVPFRIRVGIGATVWPHLLTRQSIIIETDLRAITDIKRVTRLRAMVNEQTSLITPRMDDRSQVLELSAEHLTPGQYTLQIEALDDNDDVISATQEPLTIPAQPDWWVNRATYGSEPRVPKPWTPIVWQDRTANVWGRSIAYGESALPMRIANQDADLLAAPVDVTLHAAGKAQPWQVVACMTKAIEPDHVDITSVREASGVRLTTNTRLEFDGFMLVDLTIEPTDKTADIDKLDLVIPVRAEHAAFLTNYRNAPGPGKPIKRHVGPTPEHYQSPVMLTTWLGTDTLGLEWSCESSRDWYLTDPDEAIEVMREGDRTTAVFHLIDDKMTLNRKRHIRFGLIPTPTKPVDPSWRNWRIDGLSYWPPAPGQTVVKGGTIATEDDLVQWNRQYGMVDVSAMLLPGDWSGTYIWHAHVTDPDVAAKMRLYVSQLNKHNMIGMWNGGWGVAPYAPQWDPWGKEMVARPVQPTFAQQFDGTYTSPYMEFMVGSWALNIRDLGLQGIRFDTVIPWKPSANEYLGETWSPDTGADDSGKTFGTQALFRQRELVKRLYREFQANGQPGVFWLGIAGPPIMACESFITIHEVAEGFYMNAASIKEAYPQEMVRPWMTSRAYGFIEVNNLKGSPLHSINRMGPLLVADASPRFSGRDGFNEDSYEPQREYGVPAHRVWDSWSWIDRGTAQWHPHWSNGDMVTTSASGGGEHYASLHLQPGQRVLLVVANYEKDPLDVTVELDLASLGFAPDAKVAALDAVTRQPVTMSGGTLPLSLLSENFRLIRIAAPDQLQGSNLDPLHPVPLP